MQAVRVRPAFRTRSLLVLLLAFVAFACSSTSKFRDAQSSFNEAATLENQNRIASWNVDAGNPDFQNAALEHLVSDPSAKYQETIALLDSMDAKELQQLEQDKLTPHAMTLKAMSQWKLKLWVEADTTAKAAIEKLPEDQGPRDHVLLKALPGLIRNDQAYTKMQAWGGSPGTAEFEEIADLLAGKEALAASAGAASAEEGKALVDTILDDDRTALGRLHQALAGNETRPIGTYIRIAELSALKNLADAYARTRHGNAVLPPNLLVFAEETIQAAGAAGDPWRPAFGL